MRSLRFALTCTVVLAACHDSIHKLGPLPDNLQRTISAAGWDSLPLLTASNGTLVCLSDHQSPCPFDQAVANWLDGRSFATWQANRLVQAWTAGHPDPMSIGDVGPAEKQYSGVTAIAMTHGGYTILDAGTYGARAMLYDSHGNYQSAHPIPQIRQTMGTGFSGNMPVLQSTHAVPGDSIGVFEVRELDSPGDTTGLRVLKVALPWLQFRDGKLSRPLPLFPTLPSFSIAADSDVIWSPGDVRSVQRVSAHGQVRWNLASPADGGPVTPAALAAMRQNIPPEEQAAFDARAAETKAYPAVAGLLIAPDERVLLLGPTLANHDSITLFTLDRNGAPTGRLMFPRRRHPLLFAGDSILVQQAGANDALELRWVRLGHS